MYPKRGFKKVYIEYPFVENFFQRSKCYRLSLPKHIQG
jgi:hypothetical protein